MALRVQRQILAGSETAFTFGQRSTQFLVKNFTDADIYVSFTSGAQQDEMIKIPTMVSQMCMESLGACESYNVVYVTGTGEVEVQQL